MGMAKYFIHWKFGGKGSETERRVYVSHKSNIRDEIIRITENEMS